MIYAIFPTISVGKGSLVIVAAVILLFVAYCAYRVLGGRPLIDLVRHRVK